jgi:hypothetical protein
MLHVCHTTKGPSKGHKCWKAFTALLMQEVLQSGDLPASLVSDKQGKKRVMGAVNKTVGQEFGVWKRAQMTTSST